MSDFKEYLPDFRENKRFRLAYGFSFVGENKTGLDFSEEEIPEEKNGEALFHIATIINDGPPEPRIESEKEIIQIIKMFPAVCQLFEAPPPLDTLMDLSICDNSELVFYTWKLICKLTQFSDFCVSYFVEHDILRQLCLILIDSDDSAKLKFVLKTLHHIAGSNTKESFIQIFRPIKIKDGCDNFSPLVCIMSAFEKHTADLLDSSITPEGATSSCVEKDDVFKIRKLMITFLNACIGCLAKSKLASQISDISGLIAKSINFPDNDLKKIAIEGFNRCMHYFPDYVFTVYKDIGLGPQLKLLLKQGPPFITVKCMEIFIRVFRFKHEEALRMFELNFFEEISIFLNPEELSVERTDAEKIKLGAIELISVFLEVLHEEIKNSTDEKRSALFFDAFKRFIETETFWKLDDIMKDSMFDNKGKAAIAVSYFINTAPDENVVTLMSEHSTMINGLCSVLAGTNFEGFDEIIKALISLLQLYVKIGHFDDFLEILNEMDTRDEIERIIDDETIPKTVRFFAKTLSGDIIEQVGDDDDDGD